MNFLTLYADCQTLRLVNANGTFLSEVPPLVRGDQKVLRIHFVDVLARNTANANVQPRAFAAGTEFTLTARAAFGGTVMVLAEHATHWNQAGHWDGESGVSLASGRCSCLLELHLTELMDAIAASPSLNLWFDIQMSKDGAASTLFRGQLPVLNDVSRNDEGDPGPASPQYPTMTQFDARIPPGVEIRVIDDQLHFYLNDVYRGKL